MRQTKRANLILVGVVALVALAGAVAFQMTRQGQPVPAGPGQTATPVEQKR